jgi:hypothetical protein
MIDRKSAQAGFWNTKLGHAAIASIAAMTMMIALSSQIQPGPAHAAPLAPALGHAAATIEIA